MNNKVQKCKNLFVCSKTEQIRLKNSDKKIEINLAFSSLNCGLNFSEISRQKYLFSKFCLRSREDFKRYLAWIQSSRSHEHLIFLKKIFASNLAGLCQQTFCVKQFVDNTKQCFAFKPQANFPNHNLTFRRR